MSEPALSGLKPRPGIERIQRYVPGQRVEAQGRSIKLSANESALGPSPQAIAAYHAAVDGIARYPDANAFAIREAIAARYGVDVAKVLMGIGSDELLSALVRAYAGPGDEVLYPTVTFPMYRIYALAAGAEPVRAPDRGYAADVDAILAQVTARTRIVILANPNNPTGTYIRATELARLRAGLRSDILLIIDAAYAEYVEAADFSAGSDVVEATANTAMTRTFSKIHGLASLRIGWCYAHPDIIGVVGRIRSPFNISTAAQAAGVAALADVAWQESVVAHTRRWRDALTRKLQSYDLEVTGTEANFVNCGFPEAGPKSAAAVDAGLRERGISVRPMAGFGLPHHLRITIGTEREMHDVIAALDEILGGAGAA